MLIISRKWRERLRIRTPDGKTVWVEIVDLPSSRVRIGIEADKDVEVLREELVPRSEGGTKVEE